MAFEVDSLFQAVDIILAERLKEVSYDATEICSIVDISDRKNGKYMVSPNNGETKYAAYSESTDYQLNDLVRVSVPNGDYTQKKYIDGKYVDDNAIVPITYASPLSTVVDVTGNLMSGQYDTTFGLISNGGIQKTTLWSIDLTKDAAYKDLQASGVYNTISLSAQFKTLLDNYNIRTGSFGLQLDIYTKVNPDSTTYTIRTVYLDSSEMFGNPYGFAIFTPQSKKFDLSKLNTVVKLVLSFYQKGDFTYYNPKEQEIELDNGETVVLQKGTIPIVSALIKNDNILIQNVKVGFGSDLSIIADNTLQIYTPNSQEYHLAELEETNEKNIGFLWYNKDENNQYLGFSDGIYDPDYDEIAYIEKSNADYRLIGQKGQENIPTDKNSLTLAADISESTAYLDNISNLISKELTRTLKTFKSRVLTVSQWVTLIEAALSDIDDKHQAFVNERTYMVNVYAEFLAWNAAIQQEYNKKEYIQDIPTVKNSWQDYTLEKNDKDEEIKIYKYPNLQKWWSDSTKPNLYENIKTIILDIQDTIQNLLDESVDLLDNGYSGFKGIFDTYKIRIDKINTSIDNYFKELEWADKEDASRMINNHSIMLEYPKTSYVEYVQQDFSNDANKYCIYWYRYDPDDSGEEYDEFAGPKWKRLLTEKDFNYESETNNSVVNFGLPIDDEPIEIDGKQYYSSKSFDTKAMIIQLMTGLRVEEKYKIILFHNHEKYETKELVFTNLDDIPDPTTVDKSAAIVISHGDKSQETYQSYGVDNTLVNQADANIKRWLKLSYEGLNGGNEILADAQVYWYVPTSGTMLTTNDDDLCNSYGFVSDKNLETKPDYSKEGYICYYKKIGSKKTSGKDQDGNTIDIISAKEEDLGFYYKIKPYYMPTSNQNTVLCKVIKGEYSFETEILITFNSYGTSGTDYTLVVMPAGAQSAVYAGTDLKLDIALFDYNNNEIPIFAENPNVMEDTQTASGFTAEWVGPTSFDGEENIKIDESTGAITGLTIKNNTNTSNYYGALKATVQFPISEKNKEADDKTDTGEDSKFKSSRLVNLSTIYPLAYSAGDYYIEGATTVVYDSQGGNPVYYKDPYKIFNIKTNKEVQLDIQENESIEWEIHYYKTGKDNEIIELTKDDADYNICMSFMPKLNDAHGLAPSTMYMDNVGCYATVQCWLLERKNKKALLWAQSIVILQNRYPSAMLNSWDGSLTIDEKNGTILSSMVGAGRKTANNTFEGVLMGDIEIGAGMDLTGNKAGLGIYGFNDGAQSFGFNVDGTGFIGKAGRGRILFDGNEGTIGSASYYQNHLNSKKDTPASAGMLIDLDDGFIDMRGGTNYNGWSDWQGLVNAEYLAKVQAAVYKNQISQSTYDEIADRLLDIQDVAMAYEDAVVSASIKDQISAEDAAEILEKIEVAREEKIYPTRMTLDYLKFEGCIKDTEIEYLDKLTEFRTAVEQEYQRGNITADQYHKAIMENNYTLYETYEDYKARYGELYLQQDVASKLVYGDVITAKEVQSLDKEIKEKQAELEKLKIELLEVEKQFLIEDTEATFIGDREKFYDFLDAMQENDLLTQESYDKCLLTAPVNSHVHLSVKSPYFYIISEQGRRILNIGDDTGFDFKNYKPQDLTNEENLFDGAGYYLKSNDFTYSVFNKEDGLANTSGSGFLLDLTNGHINAFNLSIASKNIFVDSGLNADPFFVVKDNDGCNLIYAGQTDFYLQSHTYSRFLQGDRLPGGGYYPGLRFETSQIEGGYKYVFDIRGHNQSIIRVDNIKASETDTNGHMYLQSDNYQPYISGEQYGQGLRFDLLNSSIDAYNFEIMGMNSKSNSPSIGSYIKLSSKPELTVFYKDATRENKMLQINPEENGEFYLCSADWIDTTYTITKTTREAQAIVGKDYPTRIQFVDEIGGTGHADQWNKLTDDVVLIYDRRNGYCLVTQDQIGLDGWWVSEADFKSIGSFYTPPGNVVITGAAGMKFDIGEGILTCTNASNDKGEQLILDASKDSQYPFQIGGTNELENGQRKLNFYIGWDGRLGGGTSSKWSIAASGQANFSYLSCGGGYFGGKINATSGSIGGITISGGGLSGGGWSLNGTSISIGGSVVQPATLTYCKWDGTYFGANVAGLDGTVIGVSAVPNLSSVQSIVVGVAAT